MYEPYPGENQTAEIVEISRAMRAVSGCSHAKTFCFWATLTFALESKDFRTLSGQCLTAKTVEISRAVRAQSAMNQIIAFHSSNYINTLNLLLRS